MPKHRDKLPPGLSSRPHRHIPLPTIPTTSRDPGIAVTSNLTLDPPKKSFMDYIYNRELKECCGRTCTSWIKIVSYSIMYLLFLATYTLIFLFTSLFILKSITDYKSIDKSELLSYPENGIGLTATPTSLESSPLIWYKKGEKSNYQKYTKELDKLLIGNRRKREVTNLGPCGKSPYGYGDKPCVIIRINRQLKWRGKPIQLNSTMAATVPREVKSWMNRDKKKLWLRCSGYHSYDREHIGSIKYYPDPPGFDPDVFPLDKNDRSPLVAIQISNFTVGISLAVQCKLWYERGPSTIEFVLYVAPEKSVILNKSSVH